MGFCPSVKLFLSFTFRLDAFPSVMAFVNKDRRSGDLLAGHMMLLLSGELTYEFLIWQQQYSIPTQFTVQRAAEALEKTHNSTSLLFLTIIYFIIILLIFLSLILIIIIIIIIIINSAPLLFWLFFNFVLISQKTKQKTNCSYQLSKNLCKKKITTYRVKLFTCLSEPAGPLGNIGKC